MFRNLFPTSQMNMTALAALLGAIALSSLAIPQKIALGIDPFTIKGFIVPILFGALTGGLLGYIYARNKSLLLKNIEAKAELQKANVELEQRVSERTKEVKLNEARFRAIAEASPNIIVITRISDGKIVYANPSTYTVSGYQPDDLIGDVAPNFYVNPDERALYVDALKKTGSVRGFEVLLQKKDGTPFKVKANSRVVTIDDEPHIVGELEDITAYRYAEQALKESEERFSLAMRGANDGLWDWNLKTDEVYFSPGLCRMQGYEQEELEPVLDTWATLVNPSDKDRVLKEVQDYISGEADTFETEFKMRHKDGSWVSLLSRAFLVHENGEAVRLVGTHVDITQRKEIELREHEARVQAESASQAKTNLMANMSHELRTPLNAIIGFSSTMQEETFGPIGNEKYREYLDDINLSGQHLLELINDILDVSAIEQDFLELSEVNVDMPNVVEVSVRITQPRAEHGQIEVTSHLKPGTTLIYADERRVKQIILNLLSNAVKFTPEGGKVVIDSLLNEDGSFSVFVSDTGYGMSDEETTIAMTQFGQVDSGHDRKHEGTGLGLPLTKGLMELHGGTLEIDSLEGYGTMVTATFPKERVIQNVC